MCESESHPIGAATVLRTSPLRMTSNKISDFEVDNKFKRDGDYLRWRPNFHLMPTQNWMNDPCGPCYDSTTGVFHLLYQCEYDLLGADWFAYHKGDNPHGANWGNMSWMHATSRDLVHWQHVQEEPALRPSVPHDCKGVFSGTMVLHGPHGESDMLTAIYTAVSKLPIHYTEPYHLGCEKLAMAVSHDNGKTWKDEDKSVILDGPPSSLADQVVAWRDPFFSEWRALDNFLGMPHGKYLYGLISGSLRNKTPTVFLYQMERTDLTKWQFITTMADVGMNFSLGYGAGDMGQNWEVCNFFTECGSSFLIMNVEGVGGDPQRRQAMWTKVSMRCDDSKPKEPQLVPSESAVLDYGNLYAVTTFEHIPSKRRLLWGWITEEDLDARYYEAQSWSGCMCLPREVVTLVYEGVDPAMLVDPHFRHSFWTHSTNDAEATGRKSGCLIATLGIRPAAELSSLRKDAQHVDILHPHDFRFLFPFRSRSLELQITIVLNQKVLSETHGTIGVLLAHNAQLTRFTKVVYSYRDKTLSVIRCSSSNVQGANRSTRSAPFHPVRFADGSVERLHLSVFLDNSVLEVFLNDRVVLSTRIYCDHQDGDCSRASLFSSYDGQDTSEPCLWASFSSVKAWAYVPPAIKAS